MKKLWFCACCLVALAGCNNKPDPALSEEYEVPTTGRTVGGLLEQLREDDDPANVQEVIDAMANLTPEDKDAVPALVKALQDENPNVRWVAAKSLGQIEPSSREVEYALARTMEDKDPRVSRMAIEASGRIARASVRNLLGTKDEPAKDQPPQEGKAP